MFQSIHIIAIVSCSQLHRITDLLGYQNLAICGSQISTGLHMICQQAAATSAPEWSVLDTTLWNLVRQSTTRSTSVQSNWTLSYEPPTCLPSRKVPVCIEWNENLGAGCPHPFSRYDHICYRCINVPGIAEKCHKAIYCPNKEQRPYSSLAQNYQNKA